jgi:hypothetical protein
VLHRREVADGLHPGRFEVAVTLERERRREPRQPPRALRRDAFVEDRVAQVRARVEEARRREALAVSRGERRPEHPDDRRERVARRAAVDHVVAAVERVVEARAEGVARARPLADEVHATRRA